MVIVVPALAHGEDREQPVVARIVAGHVALPPGDVRHRVDREGSMPDQHGAPAEADHEAGPARDQPGQRAEQGGRQVRVPIEPHQLRIAGEVGDRIVVGGAMPRREDPADVRTEKPCWRGECTSSAVSEWL